MPKNIKNLTIIIPIKGISKRCPNKNFRPFYKEKSLLEIKLIQLSHYFTGCRILVITDICEAALIIKKTAKNIAFQIEVIVGKMSGIFSQDFKFMTSHVSTKNMMRVCVTTPFINGKNIHSMFAKFIEIGNSKIDSLIAVEKIQKHLVDQSGMPFNYNYGSGHIGSELLTPLYVVKAGVFILKSQTARQYSYHFGKRPYLYEFDALTSLDINKEQDWNNAQNLLQCKKFISILES
jgi:CMP-N-acetylneuraminic acid synthetase